MNNKTEVKPSFIKKRDIIIIAALLVIAAVIYFTTSYNSQTGSIARLSIITSSGDVIHDIPLNKDKLYTLEDGALPVYLEVKDGRIRFVNSVCPDHNCEGFGWLQHDGDWAACMPAGASLRIVEPL